MEIDDMWDDDEDAAQFCAPKPPVGRPPNPLPSLDWRTIDGVRQTVVPLYGARPEWIRDDDMVRVTWVGEWRMPFQTAAHIWEMFPAVILRHRDDRNGTGKT